MRQLAFFILFYTVFNSTAQDARSVVAELNAINGSIENKPANSDSAAAISHRAMNVFLADKTGYLSGSRDLSYYTNYATFNSTEGRITVNHNFQQRSTGIDHPIKTLFTAGLDMVLASTYTKGFLDNRFENQLGVSIGYKRTGNARTGFSNDRQKHSMDALRLVLLQSLITAIEKKETEFKQTIAAIDASSAAGKISEPLKDDVQKDFYTGLIAEYQYKFASLQAELLNKTGNFKKISSGWTSITAYLPLVFPKYTTAGSLTANFVNRHPYAASLSLEHTRLWESARSGRLFLTGSGRILFNNAKLGYGLSKLGFNEYKTLGGTNNQPGADAGNDNLYIGTYQTFITASLSARAVYFPADSHVGISLLAEQNFGTYQLLNLKLAVPVVLINSQKTPALTIECFILFLDCSNRLVSNDLPKTQLGLSLGIPFSRLMF